MTDTTEGIRPRRRNRFGRIADGPVKRDALYELAAQHEGLFKKLGNMTIVDFDKLDEILETLPNAVIRGRTKRRNQAA